MSARSHPRPIERSHGPVRRPGLTDAQAAVEPRSLALMAHLDGYADGYEDMTLAQPLSRDLAEDERQAWRNGWVEGRLALQRDAELGLFDVVFTPGLQCPEPPR